MTIGTMDDRRKSFGVVGNGGSENPLQAMERTSSPGPHSGIVGMAGVLGFGLGFSFPKIGVLVAIAVGSLQLKLLLVLSLLQHRKS